MLLSYKSRALALPIFTILFACSIVAQTTATPQTGSDFEVPTVAGSVNNADEKRSDNVDVQKQLREQQLEMQRLRELLARQERVIDDLRQRVEVTERAVTSSVVKTDGIVTSDTVSGTSSAAPNAMTTQTADQDTRIAKVEEQSKKTSDALTKQLGSLTFSGDVRIRYEGIFGALNATPNGDNPAILGNPLTVRNGFRLRARFGVRGQINKELDWGIRLATGSYSNSISTNQTLTDFFNRKAFGLDQAYIAWSPSSVPGLRLQAGKFDIPWVRTEMTIDNDLQLEGFNETYSRGFKGSVFKNLTFVAWQLPILERTSGFVRNANGTVNVDESRRAGRDLAMYGAQIRGRFDFTPTVSLTLAAADLYYSGTQFISPIQAFGANLLIPVTITIPATATSPAQTITTQVAIPRDLLVAGQGNLGLTAASTNAINRDGRLASGYNLIDVVGRLDFTGSKRFPITLLLNYVTNTQTHDVVIAGPGGENLFLKNNENNGYYAEIQAGRQKERGDLQFGYTFIRIEKDAVLTPFNFSDLFQQSDSLSHRLIFNYTADPRVVLSVTAIIGERPNGLLGVFGSTPTGSLNNPSTRLQVDTIFRF